MKIAVIWDWGLASWAKPLVWDGFMAALKLITKDHQVDWYLDGKYPQDIYDVYIPWGVGSIPFNNIIEVYHGKKILMCAGHPQDTTNFEKFDTILVESPEMRRLLAGKHPHIVLAFGTDTDMFKPDGSQKIIDCFYPATFSQWKRQDLFTKAVGNHGLACGTVQPDGELLYKMCRDNNTYTLAGLVPTALVAKMYNLAKCCIITSWHGSERTLLEAMASNCPVVLTRDNLLAVSLTNDKVILVDPTVEAIKEGVSKALIKTVNTREYVLTKYSHQLYAKTILNNL